MPSDEPPPPRRRPTFRRSNPQPIRLTDDDIAIVRYVARYRFRRSSDIYRYLSHRPEKKLRNRQRRLYDAGYLDRPLAQQNNHLPDDTHIIYALGDRGATLLTELDGFVAPKSDWSKKNRAIGAYNLQHTLRIGDLAEAADRLPNYAPAVRVIPADVILDGAPLATRSKPNPWRWQAEHREPDGSRRPVSAIPDLVFGLDLTDQRRRFYFFSEADRGTEPVRRTNLRQSSVGRKFEAYLAGFHAGLHRQRYGIGNLRFLFATTSRQRIDTMREALLDSAAGADTSMFFFAESTAVRDAAHLLAVPWLNIVGEPARLLD